MSGFRPMVWTGLSFVLCFFSTLLMLLTHNSAMSLYGSMEIRQERARVSRLIVLMTWLVFFSEIPMYNNRSHQRIRLRLVAGSVTERMNTNGLWNYGGPDII